VTSQINIRGDEARLFDAIRWHRALGGRAAMSEYVSLREPHALHSSSQMHWREITRPRRMILFFWAYVAQALAGSLVGFTIPFLYYFGLL
jgi:hypothetical protein